MWGQPGVVAFRNDIPLCINGCDETLRYCNPSYKYKWKDQNSIYMKRLMNSCMIFNLVSISEGRTGWGCFRISSGGSFVSEKKKLTQRQTKSRNWKITSLLFAHMRFFVIFLFLFVFISLQDADNVSFCTASNVRTVCESWVGKDLKGSNIFMIRDTIAEIVFKQWVKSRSILRMTTFQAGIKSDHPLNVHAKSPCSGYCEDVRVNEWSELRQALNGARGTSLTNCSWVEYRNIILK